MRMRAKFMAAMGLVACGAAELVPGVPNTQQVAAQPAEAADATVVDASPIVADTSVAVPPMPVVDSSVSSPIVDAGRPRDAGRVAALVTSWQVTFPLPAAQQDGMTTWCTKQGTATCMPASEVSNHHNLDIGQPPPAPRMSAAVTDCPAELPIECPCNTRMGCFDLSKRACSEPLMPTITRLQRAAHPNACCYEDLINCGIPGEGRPLRDDRGELIVSARSANLRRPKAAHWERVAIAEHASVAAFARLSLELMSLGAPAALVRGAHSAALDELEHARVAYALASHFHGSPLGPKPLPIAITSPRAVTIIELAIETLVDGCLGEAVGARLLAATAERMEGLFRSQIAKIAEDEERHAELAFAILAWCANNGAMEAIADTRAAMTVRLEASPYLAIDEARAIAESVRREVIDPCLDALLSQRSQI